MSLDKFFWFDLETTGLRSDFHEIHELSAILTCPGKPPETLHLSIKPNHPDRISPEALSLRALTPEQLNQYPPSREAYAQLISFLEKHVDKFNRSDKLILAGYNIANFDIPFLNQFFLDHHDKFFGSWFHRSPVLDVIHLVSLFRVFGNAGHPLKACPNSKLVTIAEALDIELDSHSAISDIKATRTIAHRLLKSFLQSTHFISAKDEQS